MPLTIKQLKPGKLYRVVDAGDADPFFEGAIVLGTHRATQGYTAVTVAFGEGKTDTHWIGARWFADGDKEIPNDESPDSEARFEPVDEPVTLTSY